jgi:hypothetical protein
MTPGEKVREHYRQQGREQERNRIIKIMETESHAFTDPNCPCDWCDLFWLITSKELV